MDKIKLNVLFGIFCLFTFSFGLIEIYLIFKLVDGNFDWSEPIAALLSTGLLAGCGSIFLKLIRGNFVDRKSLPMEKLHAFLSTRRKLISKAQNDNQTSLERRKELITHTLAFGEGVINGWLPGSHFELSVFVDSSHPLMLCYFDSKHENVARSMAKRRDNLRFYIDNDYEVCRVLNDPSSEPRMISNTHESEYSFVSNQQKLQIKSTALITIEMETPSVLVVSSNAKNALDADNRELVLFLRVLAEQIRIDLTEDNFLPGLLKQEVAGFQTAIDGGADAQIETNGALDPVIEPVSKIQS